MDKDDKSDGDATNEELQALQAFWREQLSKHRESMAGAKSLRLAAGELKVPPLVMGILSVLSGDRSGGNHLIAEEMYQGAKRLLKSVKLPSAPEGSPRPFEGGEGDSQESDHCPLCGERQFETPSGITCPNGHGGVRSQ